MSFAKSDWWNLWRRVQNFPGGKDLFKKNRISGKHREKGFKSSVMMTGVGSSGSRPCE
jgi:hypothetical protein